MPLAGTLATMPLTDLMQWLSTAGKTGTLLVERNRHRKWIQMSRGRVIGCSSDDPPQRLGQYLLGREKIDEEQLRQGLAVQEQTGQHLGRILVEMGVLSHEDLRSHLEAKAEETIYSLFDWNEGVFRFDEKLDQQQGTFPVDLQVEDILLRGLKRYDEMRRIRDVFQDPAIVLRYTSKPPSPEIFREKTTRTMYAAIDGERTIAELLLHVHGSEYQVYKFLHELFTEGYIEIGEPKRVPHPPVSDPAPRAPSPDGARAIAGRAFGSSAQAATCAPPIVAAASAIPQCTAAAQGPEGELQAAHRLMGEGKVESALEILDRLYRQHPEDDALRRLTAEAEAAFIDRAYRHLVPAQKIPVLTRPVEQMATESLTPHEFFLLSRIDGTWDVKSIIQVAPLREVDALRTLRRMRELGMIELRDP